ncbi:sensor histidine kinase [Nocardioides lacusdianchii]|uniref:sensor histidine kinase n=1 Tax=Nocardioides lacusdianchii TaxID=2783664 RepID=UPI001CCC0438|nr:HAMP domain-containing sensor histidine kinase [Nocardioides lacusdianchii]
MRQLRLPGRPLTLTTRLVAVVVLLVAVTALAIGTATTIAMRENLDRRLDQDVRAALSRTLEGPSAPRPQAPDGSRDDDFGPGQELGSLSAVLPDDATPRGMVLSGGRGWDPGTALTDEQLAALSGLEESDRDLRTVRLPGLGDYRVAVADLEGGQVVAGLPLDEVEDTVADLLRLELLATLVGIALAAVAAVVVVRRQLAPLREVAATAHRVAELPLASGEIEMAERVPAGLTDERTEIGQVGSALNAMLDHVESSLAQRHRSEQQVRQFVADASHELRTPLATIAGYTELARRRPETTGTALAKVETESARMTALVEDLLLLARLDSGRPLEREPVDLSRLLLEAVNDARVVDPDHQWRLSLPDAPLTVTGDAARLHQVVTNLLTNARKYTPDGSTVTVTGNPSGFTVHDDGPGFSPELAPRAFERFVRGDVARTRAGGAGLGLSLVEAIVAAHGGTVALTSAPGDTTVTVILPR